jgi:hypothetical protein
MDVSALSADSAGAAAARAQEAATVGVLRKSLDAEQSAALELIQALAIPGLGQNVDLKV